MTTRRIERLQPLIPSGAIRDLITRKGTSTMLRRRKTDDPRQACVVRPLHRALSRCHFIRTRNSVASLIPFVRTALVDNRQVTPRAVRSRSAGEFRHQGSTLKVIASRFGVGAPKSCKLDKTDYPNRPRDIALVAAVPLLGHVIDAGDRRKNAYSRTSSLRSY